MISVIKNKHEYQATLERIERAMDSHPEPDSPEGKELEVLVVLIKDYERANVNIPPPDPISAILFRMEQQNLSKRDLIPLIGSRSKVSEVLSGKRQLSLPMIRALHSALAIPTEVLIQQGEDLQTQEMTVDWKLFPIKEMTKRGWIKVHPTDPPPRIEKAISELLACLAPTNPGVFVPIRLRRGQYTRSGKQMDQYALMAWTARVLQVAETDATIKPYKDGSLTYEALRNLAKLSVHSDGPVRARDFLRDLGIRMIVEPHLRGTYLDGAAIMSDQTRPVVALTLRHDRIDNFWFCLMHELAHVSLHLNSGVNQIYDNLDVPDNDSAIEKEADQFAGEVLVPESSWNSSPASKLKSPDAAQHLARKLEINPAIVAGRMRREFNAYQLLNRLVGANQVRCLFKNIDWENSGR